MSELVVIALSFCM